MSSQPTRPVSARAPAPCLAPAALALLLCGAAPAFAQDAAHRLGGASLFNRAPLQQLIEKHTTPGGNIFVAIPQMSRRGDNTVYRPFCIPRITVVNSSQETVEELIVGVRYSEGGLKVLGSTISRFLRLKSLRQDDDDSYHDHIKARNCEGLVGEVEVLRCVYDSGRDCSHDVRPLGYGAVRLQLAAPAAGVPLAPASRPGILPPALAPKEKR